MYTRQENVDWLFENVYKHAMPKMGSENKFIRMMAEGMIFQMLKEIMDRVYTDQDLEEMRYLYEHTSLGKKMIEATIMFAEQVSNLEAMTKELNPCPQ